MAMLLAGFSAMTPVAGQIQLLATGGSSTFLGDLGGKPVIGTHDIQDVDLQSTRYMLGAGIRFPFGQYVSGRLNGYYARVAANDKYTSNPERRNRNLNFFSPIVGGSAMLEFKLPSQGKPGNWYVFGGVEYFKFDPRTKYNNQTVRLQPLGTEGQFFMSGRSPYKLTSLAIPFGIGYTFFKGDRGSLSTELVCRKTFTDYMDDVSTTFVDKTQLLASNGQMAVDLSDRSLGDIPFFSDPGTIRGHSSSNDNFFFLSVTYAYTLGARKGTSASFNHKYGHRRVKHSRGNRCNDIF